jgi:hypothetical protein
VRLEIKNDYPDDWDAIGDAVRAEAGESLHPVRPSAGRSAERVRAVRQSLLASARREDADSHRR